LTILLGIASGILAINALVTLYKCMCSRNYARWRASWSQSRRQLRRRGRGVTGSGGGGGGGAGYYTEFRETVPLVLAGHKQVGDL